MQGVERRGVLKTIPASPEKKPHPTIEDLRVPGPGCCNQQLLTPHSGILSRNFPSKLSIKNVMGVPKFSGNRFSVKRPCKPRMVCAVTIEKKAMPSPEGASWVAPGERYSANPGLAVFHGFIPSGLTPRAGVTPSWCTASNDAHRGKCCRRPPCSCVGATPASGVRPHGMRKKTLKNAVTPGSRSTAHPGLPKAPLPGLGVMFLFEDRRANHTLPDWTVLQRKNTCLKILPHPSE